MQRKRLYKKIGWIIMLVAPTLYIPSIIAYKTIHYLKSGVDITSGDEKDSKEMNPSERININDTLGFLDIGAIKNADTFHVIERVNLIKKINLDATEFELIVLNEHVIELFLKEDSLKYDQNEHVLIEYKIQDEDQIEFSNEDTKIRFSLIEKIQIIKFNNDIAYIDMNFFELLFSKRFLKIGPLNNKVDLLFSYDKSLNPSSAKATYSGLTQTFDWSYSIT